MTCASCAAHIEKHLNRLDGVEATVNFATEAARVAYPDSLTVADLVDQVEAAGYRATPPAPAGPPAHAAGSGAASDTARPDLDETGALRARLAIAAPLAAPVVVLAMVPSWQFDHWQWLSLVLAAPVAVWGAWPFHRAALAGARHGAATMDTLISAGVIAAFAWSLYALFFGTAGDSGLRMHFSLTAAAGAGTGDIYLEVAAGVPVAVLAGRYLEIGRAHV